MLSGFFCLVFGQVNFLYKECLNIFYHFQVLPEIPELNANIVDPEQTPRSVASDLVYIISNVPFMGH